MTTFDAAEVRLSYANPLVEKLRDEGELVVGELTFLMPTSFGFCWGVDRALAMVEEARKEHEGRSMWLLSSIIHNPRVNQDLRDKGIRFLKGPLADEAPEDVLMEKLGPSDLVFIPAFSAEIEDMKRLEAIGVQIVDTTCPWVIKPHKRTQKYILEGFTVVIHGTVGHDETRATCSLVEASEGRFVVVHDLEETEILAAAIEGEIDEETLRRGLHDEAFSSAFEIPGDLVRIGIINQTTMLATESRAIGNRLKTAIALRDGDEGLAESFRDFDTICRATQDNQDAAGKVAQKDPDLFVVVGGFDSSNTRNLARVGDAAGVPAFHIEGPECVGKSIRHRARDSGAIIETSDWLPMEGPVTVAFTAGASTPDTILGMVVEKIAEMRGENLPSDIGGSGSTVDLL